MNDKDMRKVLVEFIMHSYSQARIFQEKNIGASICDVMVVDEELCGYEIKSDSDNYERLANQIAVYDRFFDRNYIVVGAAHLLSVPNKVPQHWGIIYIDEMDVRVIREAERNSKVSRKKQLSILWMVELKNILVKNGLPICSQKNREEIIDKIIESVDERIIGKQVVGELLKRDYSMFNGKDNTIIVDNESVSVVAGLPVTEVIDALSEQNLETFTLAHWVALYRRGKKLFEKKREKGILERAKHEISYENISVSLGAPWINKEIIRDFIIELLQIPNFKRDSLCVYYEEITGNWSIPRSYWLCEGNVLAQATYGLQYPNAIDIIEDTLNLREIKIYDNEMKLNQHDTLEAVEKQRIIREKFEQWVWQDEDRKWQIEEDYNKMFSAFSKKRHDGSKLNFPDMSKDVTLYDYQKNAVQAILDQKNTLLAFDVGAGKTYIMIAAAMEMRRKGLSRKNMFVVPNNIVGQWESMFERLYPNAKLLTVSPNTFKVGVRDKVMAQMRDGDYDGIIIAYSCFEMIKLSTEFIVGDLMEKLKELQTQFSELFNRTPGGYGSENEWKRKKVKKEIDNVQLLINKLLRSSDGTYDTVYFDHLKINTIFLDEAHNYKNIPFKTKMKNVRGINPTGSEKCYEMLQKIRCVQRNNGGRGAVFSTGTPLSNSLADAYVLQTYLQFDDMSRLKMDKFDNWVKTFAVPEQVCEVDVTASNYRIVRRFSRFHNLKELSAMFSQIAVFYAMEKEEGLPNFDGYNDEILEKSSELDSYMTDIVRRADAIRKREVNPAFDNMLKVSMDGRKAALDLTLVSKVQPYDDTSKIVRCVKNVVDVYRRFDKCAQLIFCDSSTPDNQKFNVYFKLKQLLMESGVDGNEISFIHDHKTEQSKLKLYNDVNSGKVRVLIGSTFKLGIGANVQTKLKAIHHLDVPWRPADMVQREGRMVRRGNEYSDVLIYRYITQGSFDSYSWQLLESKQNFISQFLSGSTYQKSCSDLEDNVLTYAEAKALALSTPEIKELAEKENELKTLIILDMREKEKRAKMKEELFALQKECNEYERKIVIAEEDYAYVREINLDEKKQEIRAFSDQLSKVNKRDGGICIAKLFGFTVSLPATQNFENPYVLLKRSDLEYVVNVSDKEKGNATRIANFFKKFDNIVSNYKKRLDELIFSKNQLEKELGSPLKYFDRIVNCQKERDVLRKKLNLSE